MLNNKSDIKTIIYLLSITGLFAYQWVSASFSIPIYIVYLFFSIAVSVIIHNHIHNPIWESRWLNIITDNWLTVFYGFPVFGWIPTHVQDHHKYVNKEPDQTRTYAVSEKNNILPCEIVPCL